ncbi:MAG: ABC transporter permease subunit [Defluviitaleaceae bacterium]|nr:ABC transporter permease subunit [Defluviitaleaceae bacterium]
MTIVPTSREKATMFALRLSIIVAFIAAFVPAINPARVSGLINSNDSLFTNMVSFESISSGFGRALNQNWIDPMTLTIIYIGAIVCGVAIALLAAAFCLSLGNAKLRRLGVIFVPIAAFIGFAGTTVLRVSYGFLYDSPRVDMLQPIMPNGSLVFYALFLIVLLVAVATWFSLPKPVAGERYELDPRYRLFLMILPFLVLIFLFAYLPLWGWRLSFFDFRPGFDLSADDFVGIQWLTFLFENPATRNRIGQVLTNTLAMSGIGIATSWLPMVFAIFLSEMRSRKLKRTVQTLTTVPNFISWVLVYSVAFAIFSTEGFFSWALLSLGFIEEGQNWLMSGDHVWLKMWAWGTWKGLGWGAIIYLAAISGIDQELYEAAEVDGAGRFSKMWHITVPGLLSTFFVLLLLGISNVLNSGIEQYLVFSNPMTEPTIEVLDLYVYNLGIAQGDNISMATLVGMLKSVISIMLLFVANGASKLLRGESIV